MAAPHEPFLGLESRMPSFWLPLGTVGNGLPAKRWAELVVVSEHRAVGLLAKFAAAGVPARMASNRHGGGSHGAQFDDTRIWVDPEHYANAENVLLAERPQ